jgi:hypothetical protein
MNRFGLRAMCCPARGSIHPMAAAVVLACLCAAGTAEAATAVHKCSENGVVSFQNTPCRPEEAGPRPTAAQLNAERQRKLRQQGAAASSVQAPAAAPCCCVASALQALTLHGRYFEKLSRRPVMRLNTGASGRWSFRSVMK